MDLSAADLDKMINQKAAERFSPVSNGRRFLRPFLSNSRGHLLNYLFAALFLTGLLIGTLLVSRSSAETQQVLRVVLGGYVERRQTQSFSGLAASTFSSIFVSVLILFFCGFCTISQPIILSIPLFKGLGYGFSIGTLYAEYGTAAIRYVAILLLPAMFLGTILIILACRASMLLSVSLFRTTLANSEQIDAYRTKRYCVKYIAFTVICVGISLLDAAFYYQFSRLFVL